MLLKRIKKTKRYDWLINAITARQNRYLLLHDNKPKKYGKFTRLILRQRSGRLVLLRRRSFKERGIRRSSLPALTILWRVRFPVAWRVVKGAGRIERGN